MRRVRVGVIGAGMVAQVEHIPNLMSLKDRFTILGVYDPSPKIRRFVADRFGLPVVDAVEPLLDLPIEAVVIASPDPLHKAQVLQALECGLHVFCEKPLSYAPTDIDVLIAARDRAAKVLQVGYMKRFDPSYQAACERLPGDARTLRYVAVEVNDPDAWPFVRHQRTCRGDDVAKALIAEAAAAQREQVARAVPSLDVDATRGFVNAYCSALVHDVNAVHGLLDVLGVADGTIVGAQLFAKGDGGHGAVRLLDGQALWTMVHLTVPALAEYRERITLYFDDAALELEFPSPWLNHQPTRLTVRRSQGHVLSSEEVRTGYEEAFVEELNGFWSAIVEGTAVRNSAEQARRDMALLAGLARFHAAQGRTRLQSGGDA